MATAGTLTVRLVANSAGFTAGLAAAQTKLTTFGRKTTSAGAALTKGLTLPIVAVGALAIKSAIDFESAFAGVRKTVDATEDEFAALERGIRNMAKEIPASVEEIARVAEVAGQLGIETDNILEFTRTMIDLGETTNLTAEEAALSLARFSNVMGTNQKDVDKLGSSIVELGNNFETTEAEIVELATRLAGAGAIAGLSEGDVLGLATAMSSLGIQAESGGTAMQKVILGMSEAVRTGGKKLETFALVAGQTAEEFAQKFKEAPAEAITDFVDGFGDLEEAGVNVFELLTTLGLNSERTKATILALSASEDTLTDAIKTGNEAFDENTALTEEAEKRYATAEAQLKILWNRVKDVAITLGLALIPALLEVVDALDPVIDGVSFLAEAFAGAPAPIQQAIVGILTFAAALGPVLYLVGNVARGFAAIVAVVGAVNPVVLAVIVGIGLLVTEVVLLWKNWDRIWNAIKDHPAYGVLVAAILAIGGPVQLTIFALVALGKNAKAIFDGIVDFGGDVVDFFADLPDRIVKGLQALPKQVATFLEALPGRLTDGASALFEWAFNTGFEMGERIGRGIVEFAVELPGRMVEFGQRIVPAIIEGIEAAIPILIDWFMDLPERIPGALEAFGEWLYDNGPELMKALAIGLAVGVVLVVAVFVGIPALVAVALAAFAIGLLKAGGEAMFKFATGLINGWPAIRAWFTSLPGRAVGALASFGMRLFTTAVSALHTMASGVAAGAQAVISWFIGLPGRIVAAIGSLPSRLYGAARSAMGSFVSGLTSVSIPNPLSGLGGFKIPGLAAGGPVGAGSPYIVGERGPELFVPNTNGTIIPNNTFGGGRAVGGSTTVSVYVSGSVTSQGDLVDAIHKGLLRKQRSGSKLGLAS